MVDNVYAVQRQADCDNELKVEPEAAAGRGMAREGSDGQPQPGRRYRVRRVHAGRSGPANAGFAGTVAETVAIHPALAISGIELINLWYHNPAYKAIMADCAHTRIGVWSENSWDRTVVVAVYGSPA